MDVPSHAVINSECVGLLSIRLRIISLFVMSLMEHISFTILVLEILTHMTSIKPCGSGADTGFRKGVVQVTVKGAVSSVSFNNFGKQIRHGF